MRGMKSMLSGVMLGLALAACARAEAPRGTWSQKAPLPVAVAEVGVGAIDGKVHVIAGTAVRGQAPPEAASTTHLVYDPATDRWQESAPLPQGLTHVGVASLGGKLYAIGGFAGIVHVNAQASAFAYDPKANRWTTLPKLPKPVGSAVVAAVGGKLHVLGGRRSEQVVKISPPGAPDMFAGLGTVTAHEIFDPATQTWSQGKPLPGASRDHAGIAVLGGKIHVFGGRINDFSDLLDRHDVYDPATDTWTSAAPLPRPRSAGAFTVLDGLVIYVGGECKPGGQPGTANAFEDASAYDPVSDSWSALAPIPQARHAFGAATVGQVAYFAGGATLCGGGASTDLYALRLN